MFRLDLWDRIANESIDYQISTEYEGELKFTVLRGWREELIFDKIGDPYKKEAIFIAENVLKYSLYEYDNKVVNLEKYKENPDILDSINLNINIDELKTFSSLFLENNNYIIEGFDELKEESFVKKDNLPSEPIERLYIVWCKYYDFQNEWVKNNLGIELNNRIEGMSKAFEDEIKLKKLLNKKFSTIDSSKIEDDDLVENIEDTIDENNEYIEKVDAAILQTPELLKQLINIEKEMHQTNRNLLKLSNTHLEKQVGIAKEDSSEANTYSKIAIGISVLAVILNGIIGVLQISNSNNTNDLIKSQVTSIKQEIKNTNLREELIDIEKLINEIESSSNNDEEMINILKRINRNLTSEKNN